MGQIRKLAGQTAIYGVSSILGRALNYLLVPYYTSFFTAGEYGVVTDLYAYVAFLNVIYTFGLETTYFRFSTKEKDQSYFNQVQSIILLIAIVVSGALIISATPIVDFLGYSGQERFVYWFAAIMAIDSIVAIPFAKLRLEGKAKRFAFIRLFNIGLNIGLNLFFFWEVKWPDYAPFKIYDPSVGVGYVFISNLIANGFYLFLLGDVLFKYRFEWLSQNLKKIFKYALPLVFTGLAAVTNEMLSRAILKFRLPDGFYQGLSNLDALGVFGACYKLSIFMVLSIQAFRYAAEPFFFSKAEDKNSPQLFSRVMHGYVVFAAILLFAVVINLDILGLLFLRQEVYREGLDVVPYLLLGGLFLGVFYNLSVWYKLTDNTKWAAYISITGAIITFFGNWFLIPVYGYMGSAYVTAFSYLVMMVFSFFMGQKYFPIPYHVVKGSLYIVVLFIVSVGIYKYSPLEGVISFLVNNSILMVLVLATLKIENVNISQILKR